MLMTNVNSAGDHSSFAIFMSAASWIFPYVYADRHKVALHIAGKPVETLQWITMQDDTNTVPNPS
jgi:hypothetical protein